MNVERSIQRPKKPRKDFPLFPHSSGQWAKKVRNRLRYFGKWSDPEAAERRWLAQREALLSGRPVRPLDGDELLVRDLCNRFLTRKAAAAAGGEIAQRSFDEYLASCRRLARVVGSHNAVSHLVPEDFARLRADLASRLGPIRVGTEIQKIRTIFNFGVKQELLVRPPSYGDAFSKPSRKILRKHRSEQGRRMFDAAQIRQMIERAGPTLRAMILLGINCGWGNTDVATLERRRLDLRTGWADYPRVKTGVPRRCPLWPETVRAVRQVLRLRDRRVQPETKAAIPETGEPETARIDTISETKAAIPEKRRPRRRHGKLVFLTKYGRPFGSQGGRRTISEEFGRLARRCGVWRKGLNFYALRHTFQTVGRRTKDLQAVAAIMGHAARSDDMAAVYTEEIHDEDLKAVTDYVRTWLFSGEDQARSRAKVT